MVRELWKDGEKGRQEIRLKIETVGKVHSRVTSLYAWRKAMLSWQGPRDMEMAEIISLLEKTTFAKDLDRLEVVIRKGGGSEEFANEIRKALGMPTRQEERLMLEQRQKELLEKMKMEGEGKGADGLFEFEEVNKHSGSSDV